MKSKTYHKIHYDEKVAAEHLQSIKERRGKATFKKRYSESLGKHYYEISYTFKK